MIALKLVLRRATTAASFLLSCAVFITCTSAEEPVEITPAITEFTGPSTALTLTPGGTVNSAVGIRRTSNFTADVQLTTENLPSGIIVVFQPATLRGSTTLAQMKVTAVSAPPATYSFIVRASGLGVESRTVTVSVTVTQPGLSLNVGSGSVSVMQGTTQTLPITIARTGGFTGIVGLAVLGLPTGVTASFSPASLQSNQTTSTLTLTAPLSVVPTTNTVTVRASAPGLVDQTQPVQLTVTPTTTPALLLSASPGFHEIMQGNTVQSTVTVQRLGGFQGAVTIDVTGMPAEVTASAPPIAADATSTTLTINVGTEAAIAASNLVVRGTGAGVQPASTQVTMETVLLPTFRLNLQVPGAGQAAAPNLTLTVTRGAAAVITNINLVNARVAGFNQPIALSLSALPAGVTLNVPASFASATNPQTQAMQLSVAPGTAPGTYTITITGVASPSGLTRVATITLTVV